MSLLTGNILLPANTPRRTAAVVRVEIRDVSRLDVPSILIAQQLIPAVALQPDKSIPFGLSLPDWNAAVSLALWVHVSLDGSRQPKSGDLLSTSRNSITPATVSQSMQVTVQVI
jgi:uncharacterized lipoprotein YbaY